MARGVMLDVLGDAHVGAAIVELWLFPIAMLAERGCGSSEYGSSLKCSLSNEH